MVGTLWRYSMSDYNARIERAVQDLASLQRDLNQLLLDGAAVEGAPLKFATAVDAGSLRELKGVVDQVRHFLWFYLQAVNGGTEASRRTLQLLQEVSAIAKTRGQNGP